MEAEVQNGKRECKGGNRNKMKVVNSKLEIVTQDGNSE